jgi:hypothetical protein
MRTIARTQVVVNDNAAQAQSMSPRYNGDSRDKGHRDVFQHAIRAITNNSP